MRDMSTGSLGTYNSLTDKHLTGFFNNARVQKHLQKVGLITQGGRIVSDKEYKQNQIQTARQKHVTESLAQGIFQKAAELERLYQNEIKRKLEEFARKERIHKMKTERFKNHEATGMFSAQPPSGPRTSPAPISRPEKEHPTETLVSIKPKSRAGKTQKSVRLKPLRPVPPSSKKKESRPRAKQTARGRNLRPIMTQKTSAVLASLQQASSQNKVGINMVFFGKTLELANDLLDLRSEVKVLQQHPGGEDLCIYKGNLRRGEIFQFMSRSHKGFPFSLTFFINGQQVERFSSCCEFKHRKSGGRLGGRYGHFGFCGMEGATPCNKCKFSMSKEKSSSTVRKVEQQALSCPNTTTDADADDADADDADDVELRSSAEMNISQETTEMHKFEKDYDEDFEADDEGPVENGDDDDDDEVEPTSGSPSWLSKRENSHKESEEDSKEDSYNQPYEIPHVEEDFTEAQNKSEQLETSEDEEEFVPQDDGRYALENRMVEMSEDTEQKAYPLGEESGEEDKSEESEPERDFDEDSERHDVGPVEPRPVSEYEVIEKTYINENQSNLDNTDESDDTSSLSISDSTSSFSNIESDFESEDDFKEVSAADQTEREDLFEIVQVEEDVTTEQNNPDDPDTSKPKSVSFCEVLDEDEEDFGMQNGPEDVWEKSQLDMSEDTDKKEYSTGEESDEEAKPEDYDL